MMNLQTLFKPTLNRAKGHLSYYRLTGTDDKSPYSLQTMLDLYGRKGDYSDIKQTLSFTETDQKEVSGGEASTLQR